MQEYRGGPVLVFHWYLNAAHISEDLYEADSVNLKKHTCVVAFNLNTK